MGNYLINLFKKPKKQNTLTDKSLRLFIEIDTPWDVLRQAVINIQGDDFIENYIDVFHDKMKFISKEDFYNHPNRMVNKKEYLVDNKWTHLEYQAKNK